MILTLFITSSLVAGVALIWKDFLNDSKEVRAWITKNFPYLIRKPLFCGFCFTCWTAFLAALIIDPIPGWHITMTTAVVPWFAGLLRFLSVWMTVALLAVTIRAIVIAFEELLHYIVHTLNGRPGDLH